MSQYLPFGKQITATKEQQKFQDDKFKLYEMYGIPYGYIDNDRLGEQYGSEKDDDRELARMLIMMGKELPDELKERLLKYKQLEIRREYYCGTGIY